MIEHAKHILFRSFVGLLIASLAIYLSPVPYAYANPVGGNVSGGNATITTSGKTETINQKSQNAVIDWQGFNINADESTKFKQPNSSSLTVNRVHDMNSSQVLGTLSANGNIVLINPNGVFFGKGSTVDVNGILATTSNVTNTNVMAGGKLHFTPGGNPNATVENQGTITAKDAGLVGLVAPNAANSGVITAKLGTVQMSSGDSFTLDFYGDGLMEIGVSDAVAQQIVKNTGTLNAEGGTIKLTAAAGRQIVNSLIDVEGELHAPAVSQQDGVIEIYAEGSNAVQGNVAANKGIKTGKSTVTVQAKIDASGKKAGESGGNIDILGDDIAIQSGSYLDASGALAGGNIKIGGDFHGGGPTPTASATVVQNNATINANALDNGDGGNVAVWSDIYTSFTGNIQAKGGPNGGNGGYVETSGHQTLNVGDSAKVDTLAPAGNAGTWLLDPQDFTIAPSGGDMTGATITSNLTGGNVTILSSGGGTSGTGTIYVNDTISWSANKLTLTAANNIVVDAVITVTGTGALTMNTATANGGNSAVTGGALSMAFNSGSTGFAGQVDYSSSGTLTINGNAYTIITALGAQGSTTGTDLQGMSGNLSRNYALGNDINASATSGWNAGAGFTPVVVGGTAFTGNFEGLGHVITGLTINQSSSTNFVGLFGFPTGRIADVGMSGGSVTGGNYTGGLVGDNGGTISNSYSTATVSETGNYNYGGGGGLVGINTATITNSYATGNVSGNRSVGGLVGENDGTITNSYATGAITGTGYNYDGGLVGYNNAGTISNSYATGNVTSASNDTYMGGLVGYNYSSATVSNSYATGTVSGCEGNCAGLVGDNKQSAINNSYATGAVSGTSSVGGLVGRNDYQGTISNSYSSGAVSSSNQVGGLVGSIYNGGSTATNSFWDTQTSGQSTSIIGTGETTANMKAIATYTTGGATWDMSSSATTGHTWYINSSVNNGYPVLEGMADMPTSTPENITFTATSQTVTYGNNPNTTATYTTTYTCSAGACADLSGASGGSITISGTTSTSGYYTVSGSHTITLSGVTPTWDSSAYSTGTISYGTGTLTVNAKALTIDGLTAGNKVYDSTTTAALTGTPSIHAAGIVGSDSVTLSGTATAGTFASANVANGISVTPTLSGLSLGSTDAGNYTISGTTSALAANITPAGLTVTASNVSGTYGTSGANTLNGTTGFSSVGLLGGQNIGSVTLATNATSSTSNNYNADTANSNNPWTITPSAATGGTFNAGNYSISYVTGTQTITPAALTISGMTASGKTYDTTNTAVVNNGSDSFSGIVAGHNNGGGTSDVVTLGGTGGTSGTFSSANAGTWTVTGSGLSISGGADAGNYTLSAQPTASATITPAGLTITASNVSGTYGTSGANTLNGTTGFSSVGLLGGQNIGSVTLATNATSSTSNNYNADTANSNNPWTITPSAATGGTFNAGNYSISYVTGTQTITPAALTISGMTASGKTYDTTNTAVVNNGSDSFSGIVAGHNNGGGTSDVVTLGGTGGTSGTFSSANAGTWTVTGSGLSISGGADAGNYTLSAQPTASATITPAGLTITASNVSGTYGTSGANTLNGTTGFSSVGLLGGQNIGSVTLATNATSSTSNNYNADTANSNNPWTITPSAATGGTFNAGNYSISYVTGTQTITPAALTISGMTASGKTYDTTNTAVVNNGSDSFSGVVAGHNNGGGTSDVVTLGGTGGTSGTFSSANAGTWTVTGSGLSISGGADAGNYTLSAQPTASATITPAGLTITASNVSGTYGTSGANTLNGTTGFSSVGLLGGQNIGSVTLATNATSSTSNNYNADTANSNNPWTITPSAATGGTFNAGNYSISYVTGTQTITPAALTISGMTASGKTYDTTNTAVVNNGSDSFSGIVAGHNNGGGTSDVVTLGGTGGTSGTFSSANAGTWTVTGSGLSISGGADAGNYTLSGQPTASATITPAGLTITASNVSGTYGTSGANTLNGTTGFSSVGLLGGQNIGSVTLATNATSSTSNNYNADTANSNNPWTITPSAATGGTFNAGNYSISYVTGTQTITPAALTISGMTASGKTYDTTNTAVVNNGSDSFSGIVAGHNNGGGTSDVVTLGGTGGTSGTFSSANAGTWTVTGSGLSISGGADAGNYTLSGQPTASATITPAGLTVTGVTANNKVYDATTAATLTTAGDSLVGVYGGDIVNLSNVGTSGTFGAKNVGSGIGVTASGFTISGAQAGDYTLTQPAGLTANITPAHLTVTADNQNMTQGGAVPTLTDAITGFVGGETLGTSGVTGSAALSTSGNSNSNPGPYSIIAALGTLTALNYDFATFNNGTLTVAAATGGGNGGPGGGGSVIVPTPAPAPAPAPVPVPVVVAPAPAPVAPTPTNLPDTVRMVSQNPSAIYAAVSAENDQVTASASILGGYAESAQALVSGNPAPQPFAPSASGTSISPAQGASPIMQLYDPANDNSDATTPTGNKVNDISPAPLDQQSKEKKDKARRVRESLERLMRFGRSFRRDGGAPDPLESGTNNT